MRRYAFIPTCVCDERLPAIAFSNRTKSHMQRLVGHISEPWHGATIDEAGILLSLPSFFYADFSRFTKKSRIRLLHLFVYVMKLLEINFVCMSHAEKTFSKQEMAIFQREGLTFLNGESVRRTTLLPALHFLLPILQEKEIALSSLIVGADTVIGQEFASHLAPEVHEMALYGQNQLAMEKLRDALLFNEGIATEICTKPQLRLAHSKIVVFADRAYQGAETYLSEGSIGVCAAYEPHGTKGLLLTGGTLSLPQNMTIPFGISPVEKRMLAEAIVLCRRKPYQQVVQMGFDYEDMRQNGFLVCGVEVLGRSFKIQQLKNMERPYHMRISMA